jgi:hypothetical protein
MSSLIFEEEIATRWTYFFADLKLKISDIIWYNDVCFAYQQSHDGIKLVADILSSYDIMELGPLFSKLYALLDQGGALIFSHLAHGSFCEVLDQSRQILPRAENLGNLAYQAGFRPVTTSIDTYKFAYNTPENLLNDLAKWHLPSNLCINQSDNCSIYVANLLAWRSG